MSLLKTISTITVAVAVTGSIAFTAARADKAEGTAPKGDRVAAIEKSDRIAAAFDLVASCSTAAWPKIPAGCVTAAGDGYRVPARSVTVESRDEANRTSVLMRIPAVETASR